MIIATVKSDQWNYGDLLHVSDSIEAWNFEENQRLK